MVILFIHPHRVAASTALNFALLTSEALVLVSLEFLSILEHSLAAHVPILA